MRFSPLAAVLALLMAGVSPAAAQQPGRGLFRGLFGGAEPVIGREHVLDLTASAFAAYVEEIAREGVEAAPGRSFQGGSASLIYQRNWQRGYIGAYASGGASYVDSLSDVGADPWIARWGVGARAGYTRRIGRRTTFGAGALVSYSPYYSFGFGGGGLGGGVFGGGFSSGPDRVELVPGLDYTVAEQPTLSSGGSLSLTRQLTLRSSLEGHYAAGHVNFLDAGEGFNDRLTQTAGGRYRYRINEYVGVRAGYAYRRYDSLGDEESFTSHDIDAGVDGGYGREFQIARRTTFSFDTRSAVVVTDRLTEDDTFDPRSRLVLGGSAALAHRWGRSWQAEASYERSVGFVDGFREPVLRNEARATVRGVPLRRLDFIGTTSYTTGDVGFSRSDSGFSTTRATAQLRMAILRNLAAYAQYFYYRYDFERGVSLPGGIPPRRERQGGSVGLSYWLPLL